MTSKVKQLKAMYSIHDSVAGFYSPVFHAQNDNHAIRMFHSSIDLNHKADYSLWLIGQFDDENGNIYDYRQPTLIEKGINLKGKDQ